MMRSLLISAVVILLTGCLERKETLLIDAEGRVEMILDYTASDQSEFSGAAETDAMPANQAGWDAEYVTEERDDKTVYIMRARRVFESNEALPSNYAARGDRMTDAYLQFETDVVIDKRADESLCHLRRFYPKRDWAEIEVLRKTLLEDRLGALRDLSMDQMNDGQRAEILRAITSFETAKLTHLARIAFRETAIDAPQDGWFTLAKALEGLEISRDVESLMVRVFDPAVDDSKKQKAWIEAQDRFENDAIDVIEEILRQRCRLMPRILNAFMARLRVLLKEVAVTEGLGDDTFEIIIKMPGRIIGSNAGSTTENEAVFHFRGEDLRDRNIELLVTSKFE